MANQKTKHTFNLKNGQTIVVSGMTDVKKVGIFSKIPILGDIPLLGFLFRTIDEQLQKSNVTVFVTPHIVHGAEDFLALYKSKLELQEEFMAAFYSEASVKDRKEMQQKFR